MRSANDHAPHRRSGAHLIRSGRWIGVALLIVAACAGVAARRPDRPRVASASDPPQAPGVMDQARTASVSDSARAASASDPPCAQQPSQIITSTINSRTLPGDHLIYVYLPAGYCPDSATRYASIYLLHGAPGNARDWLDLTDLQATADRLIAAGTLPPAIVVLPDGNYGPLGDTQWINGDPGAGFGQAEDYMIDEVVPWIDGQYHTAPDRQHRAIGGLSAGAYGALNLAVHHPDLFGVVAAMSGFYRAQPIDSGIDLFNGDIAAQHRNSPVDLLDEIGEIRSLAIRFDVGEDDPWFVEDAHELDQALTARDIPHEFHVYAGTHDWDYWHAHLPDALRFVGAHIAGT